MSLAAGPVAQEGSHYKTRCPPKSLFNAIATWPSLAYPIDDGKRRYARLLDNARPTRETGLVAG